MLIYLLKANIALTLFYIAYRFGLRRLTFYTLNRFFLLAGIVCSALFPFIDASLFFRRHVPLNNAVGYVPDLTVLNARPATPLINVVLLYVFWAGVIVMGIRFLIQLLSLWKLHRRTTIASVDDHIVRVTKRKVTPFSFLKNIYINPSLHSPVELLAVVRHEQIHVKQLHTLDIMLGELNRIFYWFNPGAWLMSTAIRENLEFITDRCVLQQGMDVKAYQYSLINVSGIPYATAIANNFNFSHLKQRIMMMNKKDSSQYHLLRYLVLGGLVGIVLLSLNVSRANTVQQAKVKTTKDTMPKPPVPPPPPPPGPVPPPPPPPPEVKQVKFAKPKPAAPAKPAPAAPGSPSGLTEVITVEPVKPAPIGGNPLYVVDGVTVVQGTPDIKPEDIASISVIKDDAAKAIYGDGGKNGVILITSKEYAGKHKTETNKIIVKDAKSGVVPLYVIDGKPATNMDQISPDDIESIIVYKGEAAIAKYGSAAVNGVVDIKMKVK